MRNTPCSHVRSIQAAVGCIVDGIWGPVTALAVSRVGWSAVWRVVSAPPLVRAAFHALGVVEMPGLASNPTIMRWADELGVRHVYVDDGVPWCGLFAAHCVQSAGWDVTGSPTAVHARTALLQARRWYSWGYAADPTPGAVAVFSRGITSWQGHVAIVLDVDHDTLTVIGGNQGDSVSIVDRRRDDVLFCRALHPHGSDC